MKKAAYKVLQVCRPLRVPTLLLSVGGAASLRRWACILFVVMVVGATPLQDEFRNKLVVFHQHYEAFVRGFLGCPADLKPESQPKDGVVWVSCDSVKSRVDQKEFRAAREAAKQLFELEDKK